jgi:hypothetical protein
MNQHTTIQFKSFEDTLALLAALIVGGIAYQMFKASALTSALLGLLATVFVAYTTIIEFTLRDEVVTVRTRLREVVFPLDHVEFVGTKDFWGGLPGRFIIFSLRRPPASVHGYHLRTGLVSWPSATLWVGSVRAALHQGKAASTG